MHAHTRRVVHAARRGDDDACSEPAQVVLLYASEEAPTAGAKPSEALILHGCTVEAIEATEEEPESCELSISDADGEVYSINCADEEAQTAWREALDARTAPPAIGAPPPAPNSSPLTTADPPRLAQSSRAPRACGC